MHLNDGSPLTRSFAHYAPQEHEPTHPFSSVCTLALIIQKSMDLKYVLLASNLLTSPDVEHGNHLAVITARLVYVSLYFMTY